MSIITSGDKALRDISKIRKTLEKRIDNNYTDYIKNNPINPFNDNYCHTTLNNNQVMDEYWKNFDASIRMGLLQANRYAMIKQQMVEAGELPYLVGGEKLTRTYFITVRPDTKKTTFTDFYHDVIKYISRECFEHFILAFEQKGTDETTIGSGFHIHILAKMTQRSKTEVLRDTISSFKQYTADNCIQVDICKKRSDSDKVLSYIRDHKAKDGHKKVTESTDKIWRERLNLQALYTDVPEMPPSIKSDVGGQGCTSYTITFP